MSGAVTVEWAISELPFASVSKRVQVRNHSNENEFDLHENEHASETNFHMNGFALRLVFKKRQKLTRKWPIYLALNGRWPSIVCKCQFTQL